jgi:transposase InsO family protein
MTGLVGRTAETHRSDVSPSEAQGPNPALLGLHKTEVIGKRGPWRGLEDIDFATLEWVWWFNHHRLLGPIGHVPRAEYEEAYYNRTKARPEPSGLNSPNLR